MDFRELDEKINMSKSLIKVANYDQINKDQGGKSKILEFFRKNLFGFFFQKLKTDFDPF